MIIDQHGLVKPIPFIASPNCDDRPMGATIELLVIHNISLPPGEFGGQGVIDLFMNRLDIDTHPFYKQIEGLRVSAHFLIRRDGQLIQFVPCLKRAWHAGISTWRGKPQCNDFSLGVELEGTDHIPFSDAQYESLIQLTQTLMTTYPIIDIVGHADIAPQRKTDPGPCFDWPRYRQAITLTNSPKAETPENKL